MDILDSYVTSVPSAQNAIDIFKGEWKSRFPSVAGLQCSAGQVPLFEDWRIDWALEQIGGVEGKAILELGPLEGGHSFMMERSGAASITAIEANTRAFLKCLIAKELLRLKRVHFQCGDFVEYLRQRPGKFDFCIASGVLYHQTNPIELLHLLGEACDQVYIWTHYFEPEIVRQNPNLSQNFKSSENTEYGGFKHVLHLHQYADSLTVPGFCGGGNSYSNWISRDDLFRGLEHFGFRDIVVRSSEDDTAHHPNGPAISLVATK